MGKVPDLFKRPSNLASLRPAAIQQHVQLHQQQFSAASAKVEEPQLLQRLHACLDTAAIQEALSNPTQQQSTTKQQTRRQLNAYHEVFELLLASLTTYRYAESYVLTCMRTASHVHVILQISAQPHSCAGVYYAKCHQVPSSCEFRLALSRPRSPMQLAVLAVHAALPPKIPVRATSSSQLCTAHGMFVQAAVAAHQARV